MEKKFVWPFVLVHQCRNLHNWDVCAPLNLEIIKSHYQGGLEVKNHVKITNSKKWEIRPNRTATVIVVIIISFFIEIHRHTAQGSQKCLQIKPPRMLTLSAVLKVKNPSDTQAGVIRTFRNKNFSFTHVPWRVIGNKNVKGMELHTQTLFGKVLFVCLLK